MCRNIKPLFNYDPPAGKDDVEAAALQYVRKVSGYAAPSKANEAAFNEAVEKIAAATNELLAHLSTSAPTRNRAVEIERKKAASTRRFSAT